jgi:hypothetical protein
LGNEYNIYTTKFIISPKPNRIFEWNFLHRAPARPRHRIMVIIDKLVYVAIDLDTLALTINSNSITCTGIYSALILLHYMKVATKSKYGVMLERSRYFVSSASM